jgi:hypothetical protein
VRVLTGLLELLPEEADPEEADPVEPLVRVLTGLLEPLPEDAVPDELAGLCDPLVRVATG